MILAAVKGPAIDWAALSPVVALTAGACLVLLLGLARARFVRTRAVPALAIVTLAVTAGLTIWQWDENDSDHRGRARDGRLHARADAAVLRGRHSAPSCCRWPARAAEEAGHGEFYALLLTAIARHGGARRGAQNLVTLFLGFELLSIPLYVLCATRAAPRALAGVGSEVPDHRLGRLGDAALRAGAGLRRDRLDRLRRRSAAAVGQGCAPTRCCWRHRARLVGLAFKARSRPSTSGRRTSTRARRRRSRRSWPSPPRRRRSRAAASLRVALIGASTTGRPAWPCSPRSRS